MHTPNTQVYALTQPRETALIDFGTKPPMVRGAQVQRKFFGQGSVADERNVNLNAYISEDPFSETDLPVDLPKAQQKGQT
jgi:hypothetical protein